MVVIVDYHSGNVGSIGNMLKKIGHDSIISDDPKVLGKADKIILPGVGSFDFGVTKLKELGLWDVLNEKALIEKTPVLGVCLGAQLMCLSSEEGTLSGLGWLDANVKRLPAQVAGNKIPVPHMGWNYITVNKSNSRLCEGFDQPSRFYFVHSYFIECNVAENVLTTSKHGICFHSAFEVSNIIGVQFHPEKSHRFGKLLYQNFLNNY